MPTRQGKAPWKAARISVVKGMYALYGISYFRGSEGGAGSRAQRMGGVISWV